MSLNNENVPVTIMVHLGSLSADKVAPAIHLPKKSVITSVKLLNGAVMAASNDEYVQLSLKNGDTVVAEFDSRAAHEDGIAANTAEDFNLVAAQLEVAAGTTLKLSHDENEGQSEITQITCTDASALDGKTFILRDDGGSVGVWFDVDNNGTSQPAAAGNCTRALEITTVTTGMTAAQVATALAAALTADSKFTATNPSSGVVLCTVDIHQALTDAADSVNVAAVAELTRITAVADVASSLHQKGFILSDDAGTVGFWFDVGGGGTAPATILACARQVEITTISADDSAAVVAGKLVTAIDADAKFTALINADPTKVDVAMTVAMSVADGANAAGGDSAGFTFLVTQQGVTAVTNVTGFTFSVTQQGVNPSTSLALTNAKLAVSYFVP